MGIFEVAREYRNRLLLFESESGRDLVKYYQRSLQEIEADLEALLDKISKAKKSGKAVQLSWLKSEERYRALIAQTEYQISRFADQAEDVIIRGQRRLIELAGEAAERTAEAGIQESRLTIEYPWNRVPIEALESLVGFLQDGSPLKDLLDELTPDAVTRIKDGLTSAVIRGINPRETARNIKGALGGNLSRALTIARTEQLRSHRFATTENYLENSDVLDGWIRLETLDDLTCIICVVEHGKIYRLEDPFETHPNCRGTQIPKVIGFDRQMQTGIEWFNQLSPSEQRDKLGPKKYEAFKAGEIDLPSLVERTYSEKWGGGRRERTLEEAKSAYKSSL